MALPSSEKPPSIITPPPPPYEEETSPFYAHFRFEFDMDIKMRGGQVAVVLLGCLLAVVGLVVVSLFMAMFKPAVPETDYFISSFGNFGGSPGACHRASLH